MTHIIIHNNIIPQGVIKWKKKYWFQTKKGYTFTTDDYPYIIQECNVLNKLILYRKDNLPLSSNDTLSPRTIDLALYIYMKDYMNPKEKNDAEMQIYLIVCQKIVNILLWP